MESFNIKTLQNEFIKQFNDQELNSFRQSKQGKAFFKTLSKNGVKTDKLGGREKFIGTILTKNLQIPFCQGMALYLENPDEFDVTINQDYFVQQYNERKVNENDIEIRELEEMIAFLLEVSSQINGLDYMKELLDMLSRLKKSQGYKSGAKEGKTDSRKERKKEDTDVTALQKQIAEQQKIMNNRKEKIDKLRQEIFDVREENNKTQKENDKQKTQISRLATENEYLKRKIEELESVIKKKDEDPIEQIKGDVLLNSVVVTDYCDREMLGLNCDLRWIGIADIDDAIKQADSYDHLYILVRRLQVIDRRRLLTVKNAIEVNSVDDLRYILRKEILDHAV